MAIVAGDIIQVADYNTIQNKIYNVITNDYGYISAAPATAVVFSEIITAQKLRNLHNDINQCVIHQTGQALDLIPVQAGELIQDEYLAALSTATDTAVTNMRQAHASQLTTYSTSSVRTNYWTSTIQFQVDYQWATPARLINYFNLGGRLQASLSCPTGVYINDDLLWSNLITLADAQLATNLFTFYNGGPLPQTYRLSSIEDIYIDINFTEIDARTIRAVIELVVGATPRGANLDVTATMINRYSLGNTGPAPYGVPAPLPSIQTYNMNDGGTDGPSPVRILRAEPSALSYAFPSQGTSAAQTITLYNDGNVNSVISDIVYTGIDSGLVAVPTYSWGSTPATTIAAGTSTTFTVAYSGNIAGPYPRPLSNAIVITSNNDIGNVNIAVNQTVSKPEFEFTLSPVTWVESLNSNIVISKSFVINPVNAELQGYFANYGGSGGFSLDTTSSYGPILRFYPDYRPSGTYTSTVDVTATGADGVSRTHSASVTITYTQAASYNLGSWLSAPAKNNSVVGASYDVIDGMRYLTLGIGTGADESDQLFESRGINSSGIANYATAENLKFNADIAYTSGVALYKRVYQSATQTMIPSTFLTTYGAWVRYTTRLPINTNFSRAYSVAVPVTGWYNWQFSADSAAYVYINTQLTGDSRYTADPQTKTQTGSIYLNAGSADISFAITSNSDINNYSNGIAFRIINAASSEELWSTLTPIRQRFFEQPPYTYWSEVYRIPLPSTGGVPTTYQSYSYCVKDYGFAYGQRYGTYFGTSGGSNVGSMFTVTDDGYSNISISFNSRSLLSNIPELDTTTFNIPYSPYYYEAVAEVERYSQLSGPEGNGTQTRVFVGFYNDGTVRTNLVTYPGYVYTPVVDVVGGGGGGGGDYLPGLTPAEQAVADGLAAGAAQATVDAAAALADAMANAISGADGTGDAPGADPAGIGPQ